MYAPKYTFSNVSPSTTDSAIITGKPGVIMRVVGGWLMASGTATTITFNSKGPSAGTAITSSVYCGINGGVLFPSNQPDRVAEAPYGYFQSNKGEGITASTGGGTTVGVNLVYVEIS